MLEIKTSSINSLVYTTTNGEMKMQKDSSGCPITKVEGEKRAK
jgi:hypothetical protein